MREWNSKYVKWMRVIRVIAAVAMLLLGAAYIYLGRDQLRVLAEVSIGELALLTACIALFFISTGFTFSLLVSMLSVKLSFKEWIGLTFLTNAANYLGPIRPGVVVKATYLKHQKKMPFSRYSSILAANGFLLLLFSGTAGLVLLSIMWIMRGIVSYVLVSICMTLVVGAMVPFVVRYTRINRHGRVWDIINNAITGFETIRTQRPKQLAVGASIIGQYLVSALCLVVAYRALGFELDFQSALLIGIFTSISNFLTITPSNLGIQELVMAYLYTITGMDFTSGLLGAALSRAVHITLTFGLTPLFTYLLLRSADLPLAAVWPGKEIQSSSSEPEALEGNH